MRRFTLLCTVILAAACAKTRDAGVASGAGANGGSGPDAILLRFPHGGGIAHAYRWWRDSTIWTSTQRTPAVAEALAFDAQQGVLVVLDASRIPVRIELRISEVAPATKERLRGIAHAEPGQR